MRPAVQVGEELCLRERRLFHEAGGKLRVRREHGFLARNFSGMPAHEAALGPVGEPLLDL